MKAHIIENGVVTNTIEVETLDSLPGLIEASVGGIGWTLVAGKLIAPPAPQMSRADSTASQWAAIKAKRDSLSDTGGYLVGTKWFHSDAKSKTQQLGLVIMGAGVPADLNWKTMDGSFIQMTPALAGQVFAAAVAQDLALFAAGEAHRAAMEAAADPSVYDFSGDWPVAFGG